MTRPAASDDEVRAALEEAFRDEWGRVVAALIGSTRDWDLAEESTQDAFAQALRTWPRDGIPRRPGAWLTTTARRRATDVLRRRANGIAKLSEVATMVDVEQPVGGDQGDQDDGAVPDDRLRLLFTCCHPALPLEGRVALTLRTLAGLTTAEIAQAFLVSESTMAARLVRAKAKIRHAGIPYRVPAAADLPQRTAGVLAVLYLMFNEGYAASSGPVVLRTDLSSEAIRLARVLARLMPAEPAVLAFLALVLLIDARREARVDAHGDLVVLAEQDRSRWNHDAIGEGIALLDTSLSLGPPGIYQLQAAIAARHGEAASEEHTDWAGIVGLYQRLFALWPSPVVELNLAAAVAMAEGPAAGLSRLGQIEDAGRLARYHLLPATRAELLRRLDRPLDAAAAYRDALDLVRTEPERRFLLRRLAEVTGRGSQPEEPTAGGSGRLGVPPTASSQ